ncbi:electron transfer flavoprotein subunit alpha [Maritalea myrionectae]|uniref:Electron transfer flavoprotein subunit alpha n=1 Tax=Maritalea myrionectae TaxID=454601 RepID=A0A2R4M9C0_9HYPH|nr:electron transfer flavoprotein subunit alpha/FixB family protein [Maritalea myrionectae]AVX02637.1 electron transfer flavoprotein subunit alpha [Maritalea myrionectae]
MTTLLIAEHDNKALNEATLRAASAAAKLGDGFDVLVAGEGAGDVAAEAAKIAGAGKVLHADNAAFANQLAEPVADLIVSLADGYDAIVAPATSNWKNALPRVAALLDVMQISDITEVVSGDTFVRPIYAGNAFQKVQTSDAKKVITVRTTAFDAAATDGSASVEAVDNAPDNAISSFKSEQLAGGDRVDLASAKVVVSGGRAFGSKEKFNELLEPLADKLGAALGASRAAVDAGYAPNDWQVGQTGKVVAPKLYIAIGISGAIQHLAGMKDSTTIVAINTDEDAPIFSVADYGLVGDLFELVPELTSALD